MSPFIPTVNYKTKIGTCFVLINAAWPGQVREQKSTTNLERNKSRQWCVQLTLKLIYKYKTTIETTSEILKIPEIVSILNAPLHTEQTHVKIRTVIFFSLFLFLEIYLQGDLVY